MNISLLYDVRCVVAICIHVYMYMYHVWYATSRCTAICIHVYMYMYHVVDNEFIYQ